MASGLDVEAQLVLTWNGHALQLAGSGTYLILNVPSQQVLDELTAGPPRPPGAPKPPKGPDPLQQLHDLGQRLGLVLDLRVGGKTYVTFGLPGRNGPKITLSAVLGKLGSFFR
ncbi:hypothetical protein [Hymenobacter coccineus]|uniref:Uncharacterized protein n=1 Tax=Hymenobacter coccineus TaxID=1908235 RepID=A0A1G1TI47_9BACT|nr:hypothetical protein [Hymenobacter coccineus]OGX90518.1 hypothetical protein BEN49_22440 [Hymenobacter coccineus]